MTKWQRARAAFTCGSCAGVFVTGSPEYLIFIQGIKEPRRRCEKCAGEPVPELPPLSKDRPEPLALSFARVGDLAAALPFDYKAAQCREPGEEG